MSSRSSISDEFECGDCGGAVRCGGGSFRRDLDGTVLGIVETYHCEENRHTGQIVSTADGEIHSVDGLVRR